MNSDFYVYLHKRASDGVVFYVGKGRGNRAWVKSRNSYWKNVVAKHGYEVVISKEGLSEEEAFNEECKLIAFFRDLGVCLTNMTDGGEGVSGLVHSLETRRKLSEVQKGKKLPAETRRKLSEAKKGEKAYWYGKKLSSETCRKIAEALKGKKRAVETCRKISASLLKFHVLAKNIETGEELVLKGGKEMEDAGFDRSNVHNCLNGKLKTHKGHTFTKLVLQQV